MQHHFKTKAGLRRAVDQLVVDDFAQTVAAVPTDGTPAEVASARDEAVRRMLEDNPPVVNYIRREMLEPSDNQLQLLDAIVDFTRSEIGMLRDAGLDTLPLLGIDDEGQHVQIPGTVVALGIGVYIVGDATLADLPLGRGTHPDVFGLAECTPRRIPLSGPVGKCVPRFCRDADGRSRRH